MSTARTMIARVSGQDVEYRTAGDYTVAGVVRVPDGSGWKWAVQCVGTSYDSVTARTRRVMRGYHGRQDRCDEGIFMRVVSLTEATAPAVREYYGTHSVVIDSVFRAGTGWVTVADAGMVGQGHRMKAGRSVIRRLARDGWTGVAFMHQGRVADFTTAELLKRTRKA